MSIIIFNADSCVKPFEKNEQLHNAGVKKTTLCCNAGIDAISRIYFIEKAIVVQTIAGFYSCFVSILWWRCAITVIIELDYVVSFIRKAHILPETNNIRQRVFLGTLKNHE